MDSVDIGVTRVAANKDAWRQVPAAEKLALLRQVLALAELHAEEWGLASNSVRGIKPNGASPHLEGLGFIMAGGITGAYINALIDTYTSLAARSSPPTPPATRERKDGTTVVTVFPYKFIDKIAYPGFKAEIFLEQGKKLTQGAEFKDGRGLCAVLGAGNFEAQNDVLTKMFCENKVCVYKPNPVNDACAPIAFKVYAPLIARGFLSFVQGGAAEGKQLVEHPEVDEVIITGGCVTYDRIKWGSAENKAKNKSQLDKRFDAELGGVGPVLVVPGVWTDAEIEHQANQIVANKIFNGGHICASPQLLVLDKDWPQRQQFVDRICHHLAEAPEVPSYYPGSCARQDDFVKSCPSARYFGAEKPKVFENQVRPVFVGDVSPDSRVCKEEAFMLLLGETAISCGNDPAVFLDKAVEFVNTQVFGSLCISLFITPAAERQVTRQGLDDAVAKLNYGAIGINTWGATVNFFPALPWGAYPGHSPSDIQSGTGKIGNTMMVEHAVKGVVWSPFFSPAHFQRPRPGDKKVQKRTGYFLMWPGVGRLLNLLSAALLGW
eukprot:CAMPEP_0114555964 /NCGR_PEP_ID=MMETSP0114-20121206/9027_1 /TAXON_ID=31324 /ORGANISM="Goniomonas sp, Strain m" /LENGTH=548 /DNA_ID=CAMNT_0001741119 /DNA_START=17 /DNA_END=1663 /DNA_ORIENTATION=+